jgi:hypothetical protein
MGSYIQQNCWVLVLRVWQTDKTFLRISGYGQIK